MLFCFAKGCFATRIDVEAGTPAALKTGPIEKEAHDCLRQSWIIFGENRNNLAGKNKFRQRMK